MTDALLERWLERTRQLGLAEELARDEGERLLAAHGEVHRHYHDLRHLVECLAVLDSMVDLPAEHRLVAELALWFHDAVYDPRAGDNETRSAEWARVWLGGASPALADRVAALVEMTAGHVAAPADPASAAVADADLAILGAPPARYAEYADAIRREYSHVDDHGFAAGRVAVLEALAGRDPIYLRPDVRVAREAQARANITAELTSLRRKLRP